MRTKKKYRKAKRKPVAPTTNGKKYKRMAKKYGYIEPRFRPYCKTFVGWVELEAHVSKRHFAYIRKEWEELWTKDS